MAETTSKKESARKYLGAVCAIDDRPGYTLSDRLSRWITGIPLSVTSVGRNPPRLARGPTAIALLRGTTVAGTKLAERTNGRHGGARLVTTPAER